MLRVKAIATLVLSALIAFGAAPTLVYAKDLRACSLTTPKGKLNKNLSWCDLSGFDLSGKNLSRVNFSNSNLTNANFSGSNLTGADFSGANLSRANLSGSNLKSAKLIRVTANEINIEGSNFLPKSFYMEACGVTGKAKKMPSSMRVYDSCIVAPNTKSFLKVGVNRTTLRGEYVLNKDLSGLLLSGVIFTGDFRGANLTGSKLDYAQLINADFSGASFSRTSLSNVRWINVNLSSADLSFSSFGKGPIEITRVNITNVNLTNGAKLPIAWKLFEECENPPEPHLCSTYTNLAH